MKGKFLVFGPGGSKPQLLNEVLDKSSKDPKKVEIKKLLGNHDDVRTDELYAAVCLLKLEIESTMYASKQLELQMRMVQQAQRGPHGNKAAATK